MAKIKSPENPLIMVILKKKERRSYRDLSSQADLVRENWLGFSEDTITLAFSILMKFGIKFLENAWRFHHGVTQRTELQLDVLNSIQEVTML